MTQGVDVKTVMDVFSVCNMLYKVSRKPLLPFSPGQRHSGTYWTKDGGGIWPQVCSFGLPQLLLLMMLHHVNGSPT